MDAAGVVAAIIAAVASVAVLAVGRVQSKRRRLTEIVDLLGELKHAVDFGGWVAGPEEKLRTRVGTMNLSATQTVLATPLMAGDLAASELVDAALKEARGVLGQSSWELLLPRGR